MKKQNSDNALRAISKMEKGLRELCEGSEYARPELEHMANIAFSLRFLADRMTVCSCGAPFARTVAEMGHLAGRLLPPAGRVQ